MPTVNWSLLVPLLHVRFVHFYEVQNPSLLILPILKLASQADMFVKDKRHDFKEYFASLISSASMYTLKKDNVSYMRCRKY